MKRRMVEDMKGGTKENRTTLRRPDMVAGRFTPRCFELERESRSMWCGVLRCTGQLAWKVHAKTQESLFPIWARCR